MEASEGDLTSRGYGAVMWEPDDKTVRGARVTRFMTWLAAHGGPACDGYQDLWQWSVTEPAAFWSAAWDYFDVLGDRGNGPVLAGEVMPDVQWFGGATLNYARNALRTAWTDPDRTAIIFDSERARAGSLSYGQLAHEVARVARGLAGLGVGRGDRVAALLPNVPEAVIGLLAAASLGAIWSSCSPDFGARSVIDRFAQIEPTVLIACDGYAYNGKEYSRAEMAAEVTAALPGLSAVVVVSLTGGEGPSRDVLPWADLGRGGDAREPEFEEVPFAHPLWVVYSSGTTGLPKPIMHGHGGVVLEHLKALSFHQDLHPGDVFTWYTTTGWMMWNYLAGGLLAGLTIVLYDGSATYPQTDRLWRLTGEHDITYLGVGALQPAFEAIARHTPVRRPELGRAAGVLVPLLPRPEGLHVLFTERSKELRSHAGQISFPGGSVERADADATAAALREAREEVGLRAEHVEVLGAIDDCPTFVSGYVITPIVGVIDPLAFTAAGRYPWTPSPAEIAALHELPLTAFSDPANLRVEMREREGEMFELHWYTVQGTVVWGATARILHQLIELAQEGQ